MASLQPGFFQRQHLFFAAIALVLVAVPVIAQVRAPRITGMGGNVTYQGFRIVSAGGGAAAVEALRHQVDIVLASPFDANTLDFFRSQRIVLRQLSGGELGKYSGLDGVQIGANLHYTNMPILIHELMHAMHDKRLPGGFDNRHIVRFYRQAQEGRLYPPQQYLMTNEREFFAVTGTTYIVGNNWRDPFTRRNIRVRQPAFYDFLSMTLGPVLDNSYGEAMRVSGLRPTVLDTSMKDIPIPYCSKDGGGGAPSSNAAAKTAPGFTGCVE